MIEEYAAQLQACMYQYSRAIYRSIRDLIDPYVDEEIRLEYRRAVLEQCELTMERLAKDPLYFAKPDRALFQDIRRFFPIMGGQGGRCRGGDVHQRTDRGRRPRRRDRPLSGDDAKREALPAHAASRARLLSVAPASRTQQGRGVGPVGGSAGWWAP